MRAIRVVDSITELHARDAGCVAVSGSHGGASSARFALASRPFLAIFNDAGGGRDGAGFAGLALLAQAGIAACTVEHTSARIGDARSTLDDGIINHANPPAAALGIARGMACRDAVALAAQSKETQR